jgi:hypothetical protein
MKYRWMRQNINLGILTGEIESFLEDRGFKIKPADSDNPDEYRLLGLLRTPKQELRRVLVTVSKTSDGLEIELMAGEQAKSLVKLSSLISFFGGGALLRKEFERAEFYRTLEEEFWRRIEKKIDEISLHGQGATF